MLPDAVVAAPHPRVRTFHARRGRTTPRQRALLHEMLERFGLPDGPILPALAFGRVAPLVLEVGSGLGHAALGYAGAHPAHDLIAVDVHTAGVALLASRTEAAGLTNVRIVEGDALDVLDRLPAASLDALHVFFPDPWPKRAHRKRRFIRADVLDLVADRMASGGMLRVATDDVDLAASARSTLEAHPAFSAAATDRPPWRPIAGYEARALAAGRATSDFCHVRG